MGIYPRSHIHKYYNHNIYFYKFLLFVGTLEIITIYNHASGSLHLFSEKMQKEVPGFVNNIAFIRNKMY